MARIFGFAMERTDIAIVGQDRFGGLVTDIGPACERGSLIQAYKDAGIEVHGIVRRKSRPS
jgi:hypothetical protein